MNAREGILSDVRVLAVIPARGGSKGLPGKNLAALAGLPLIEHALRFAAMCPAIDRTVVSTDAEDIAAAAREMGADVPFMRPAHLAQDDTPMWPVVRHALALLDPDATTYDLLALLDPTAPARLPSDLERSLGLLADDSNADGVVAVAEPPFNPIWQCVVERNGALEHLEPEGASYGRRQEVPRVLFIAGPLYVWRTDFVRREAESWFRGRLLPLEIQAARAVTVDAAADLQQLEALLAAGIIELPWL